MQLLCSLNRASPCHPRTGGRGEGGPETHACACILKRTDDLQNFFPSGEVCGWCYGQRNRRLKFQKNKMGK